MTFQRAPKQHDFCFILEIDDPYSTIWRYSIGAENGTAGRTTEIPGLIENFPGAVK